MNLTVITHEGLAMSKTPFEVVERKGLGHPDTVCDLLAEHISYDLGQFYLRQCGHVLHYDADKALVVGGRLEPRFGRGRGHLDRTEYRHQRMGVRAVCPICNLLGGGGLADAGI